MKYPFLATAVLAGVFCALPINAQVTVTPTADQAHLLDSADPKLARNKRLVYDFWREVLEGGHLERTQTFLTEEYIQHNPNVPSGREGFVAFFGAFAKPQTIQDTIVAPLVTITAEGDLVTLAFVRKLPDPKDPSVTYTTTWFDMFRVENGKIAEHWDSAKKE